MGCCDDRLVGDPERYDSATYWAGTPPNVFAVCDKERTDE